MMNYGAIKDCDIANGPGCRVSLFVSGCTNHCKNCFQPELWGFQYGTPFTLDTEEMICNLLDRKFIAGLSILGGDPMEPVNQVYLWPFMRRIKEKFPSKTIWMYTGFTWEGLHTDGSYERTDVTDRILKLVDVLVDGKYVEELHDPALWFRGSSNQRLIDVKRSIDTGNIELINNYGREVTHGLLD